MAADSLEAKQHAHQLLEQLGPGQIAAVVNYLRTHFGNSYQDVVTAKDVRDARR